MQPQNKCKRNPRLSRFQALSRELMVGDADVRVHSGEKGKKLLDADVTDAKRMAAGNAGSRSAEPR